MKPYLPRAIEPVLRRAAAQFPAVVLTGARQAGKTTLLQHLFARTHRLVSFDLPGVETLAIRDPTLFLDRHPPPVILDEVQRVPSLLRHLKDRIDRNRDACGQYLLTGSQVFPLMAGVSESLAGRVAVLELHTMSSGEQDGAGAVWSLPPAASDRPPDQDAPARLTARMRRGGFPELVVRPELDSRLWYESYVQTYLERDVRHLRQVGDLRDFHRFMVSLAARAGVLLNLSDLARDLGIAINTAKAWLSVLEASHQVHLLPPFSRNLSKRLVRAPKVYFSDTGLLCHLLGLRDDDAVLAGATGGAVFENLVFGELLRAFQARGRHADLTFFRSSDGLEVDFLVQEEGRLYPIEVKRSATPRPEMAAGIERLRALLPGEVGPGLVLMLGSRGPFPLTASCDAVGFEAVGRGDATP